MVYSSGPSVAIGLIGDIPKFVLPRGSSNGPSIICWIELVGGGNF